MFNQNPSYGLLLYNYHRYYDPDTGRYMTSDPIGVDGGMNTYMYALSNPIKEIDPAGLAPRGISIDKKRRDAIHGASDLFDSAACDWWPASCLFKCVRWRCSSEDEHGKIEYHLIGEGYPYLSSVNYNPDDDKNCECIKEVVSPD